jgi:hypothetical protein
MFVKGGMEYVSPGLSTDSLPEATLGQAAIAEVINSGFTDPYFNATIEDVRVVNAPLRSSAVNVQCPNASTSTTS